MKNNVEITQTNDIRHTITCNNSRGEQLKINIHMNDECKNGHQDFSITGTIWEADKPKSDRYMISGGCIHDYIVEARPDLQIFVNLHLCDWEGVPMYAVENGFYHLKEGFNNTKPSDKNFVKEFCEYYRILPAQFEVLAQSENKLRYAINLEKLGVLAQWKEEANKAIAILEEMTDTKFVPDSKKSQFHTPTKQERTQEDEREQSGYYSPDKIEARNGAARQAQAAKQYAAIEQERNKEIANAELEYQVKKAVLDGGLSLENFIFYNHTQTGCFNWKGYGEKVTKEAFYTFVKSVSIPGIEWKFGQK